MHTFRIRVAIVASLVLAALSCGACSGDSRPPIYEVEAGTGGRRATGGTGGAATGGSAGQDASVGGGAAVGGTAGQDAGPPPNCGTQTCRGHSKCVNDACVCDTGYKPVGNDASDCVIDENCINIHPLEDGCRQLVGSAHAVAAFFAVDYCAGTAVLPDKLLELARAGAGGAGGVGGASVALADAFKITEGNRDLSPTESWRGIYPRDVESYLTIAIDISKSLSGDDAGRARLADLADDLRTLLVPHLSQTSEPPVGVSVLVFGGRVVELVPFTTDLNAVDAGLARLTTDLSTLTSQVGASTTALYGATYTAIDGTQRIRQLRADVTEDGVLTTGTVLVITDGANTAGDTLDANRVTNTPINVISVTLASKDNADTDLTSTLGQPGSFLAPTRADWQTAFTEIADRIDHYPDRAYLLAYCSPSSVNKQDVKIGLNQLNANQTAHCTFDANLFGSSGPDCGDPTFFEKACNGLACGGFLACGACGSSQCCASGTCSDPAPASDCNGQAELCAPSSPAQTCVTSGTTHTCTTPPPVGATCTGTCEAGVAYCTGTPQTCTAAKPAGDPCTTAAECESQNCRSLNPIVELPWCQPREARVAEPCGGTRVSAVCELGASCANNTCKARVVAGCNYNTDCSSGFCDPISHACLLDTTCHWNWASKMGEPPP